MTFRPVSEDWLELRVGAEYLCYPTSFVNASRGMDNPSPQDLGFDVDLARDLLAWGEAYDAIFPEDDPGSAAFSSPSAEDAFNNQGRSLARGVKHAVGDRYEVTYGDRRDQAWLRIPGGGG